jgi:hypothetical protein
MIEIRRCIPKIFLKTRTANTIADQLYARLNHNNITCPKKCFENAYYAVRFGHFDRLILGFVKTPEVKAWFEHAWVEKDKVFYDPTLQATGRNNIATYKAVHYLTNEQVNTHMKNHYGPQSYDKIINGEISFNPPAIDNKGRVVYKDIS